MYFILHAHGKKSIVNILRYIVLKCNIVKIYVVRIQQYCVTFRNDKFSRILYGSVITSVFNLGQLN